jgi:proliferating cell nuclear antigen
MIDVNDLDLFTKVLNAAAAVLEDEGTFIVTPNDGMTLRNMDKSRFAMVDLKIQPKYFGENFKCDREYIISIQMQDLKRILQRAGREDELNLRLDEANDTLVFTFKGREERRFVLPLSIAEENKLPDPSSLKQDVRATLVSGAITDFIKDASIIGGSVKIKAETGKMTFSSTEDKKAVCITIETEKADSAAIKIDVENPSEALYSIETFKNLILVDKEFSQVELAFSSNHPLQLLYQDDRGIEMGYLLAPMQPETEMEEDYGEKESDEVYDDEDWDDEEEEEEEEDWDDE